MGCHAVRCRVTKAHHLQAVIPFEEPPRMPEKWCSQCRKFHPATLDSFYSNKYKPDGLSEECKKCNNAARAGRLKKA